MRKIKRWRRSWIEIRLIYGPRSGLTRKTCTSLLDRYLDAGGSREDFYHYYGYREDLLNYADDAFYNGKS